MKYVDDFRDRHLVQNLALRIRKLAGSRQINIMEICGTHTNSFFRFGLDKMLPGNVKLVSGPGCPVCVSSQDYIDKALRYACEKDFIITTFGDMLKVPGSKISLEKIRSHQANISVVYSPLDALRVALVNPGKKIIFLAVGFETTAPTIAATLLAAKKENIHNLFFLTSLKTIPGAMRYLLADKELNINAFLCPGHVSVIIGSNAYNFICREYKIPCCVAGFEPLDIMEGIFMLLRQLSNGKAVVDNQYIRAVMPSGNKRAQKIMAQVFRSADASWRGLGVVEKSGLVIRKDFSSFDADVVFGLKPKPSVIGAIQKKCKCAQILKGILSPKQCPLFAKICTPNNPIGACMISSEGACNAYYRYR